MNLIKAEFYKAMKEKWVWIGLITVFIVEILTLLIQQRIIESQDLLPISAFEMMSHLIKNGIVVSLFFVLYKSAVSISSERSSKTINIIISKSIARWKYLMAKILNYFLISILFYIVVIFVAFIISAIYGNFESLSVENYVIITSGILWLDLFLSFLLILLPTLAIISVSLFCSVITKHSGLSITLLIVFFLLMYFLDVSGDIFNFDSNSKSLMFYLTYPLNNYLNLSSGILNRWTPTIYFSTIGSILYSGIFFTFSFLYFRKCDIT